MKSCTVLRNWKSVTFFSGNGWGVATARKPFKFTEHIKTCFKMIFFCLEE